MEKNNKCYDARFEHGSNVLLYGSSGSGKTMWIYNFLKNAKVLMKKPEAAQHVFFYYTSWQPLYTKMVEENLVTKFINTPVSISQIEELTDPYKTTDGSIVILDDKGYEFSKQYDKLFQITTHHSNLLTFACLQQLFPSNSPAIKHASENAHYAVLFRQLRDKRQPQTFLRQFQPNKTWIIDAYQDATAEPFSYLMIDATQTVDNKIRARTKIFPCEKQPVTVYVENL